MPFHHSCTTTTGVPPSSAHDVAMPDATPAQPRRTARQPRANTRYPREDAAPDTPPQPVPARRRRRRQPEPVHEVVQPVAPNDNTGMPSGIQPLCLRSNSPGQHPTTIQVPGPSMPVTKDDVFNEGSIPGIRNKVPSQQLLSPSLSTSSGEKFSAISPGSSPQSRPRKRPRRDSNKKKAKADDVWSFYNSTDEHRSCKFCEEKNEVNPLFKVKVFQLGTGTSGLRRHLLDKHPRIWVECCDKLKIDITAKAAQDVVYEYYARRGGKTLNGNVPAVKKPLRQFTPEAFVDAIVEFIVADDQSLNVIESPQLRAIFLMLREDLCDSDIPHRTAIRARILEVWNEHLDNLQDEMEQAPGKISTTMDMWSDPNLSPYMAVTAHWIQTKIIHTPDGPQRTLTLRADLIGFHRVPGRHSGEHLAHAFLFITDRINITHKLGWVTLDNASNNDSFMVVLEEELRMRRIPFDKITRRIRCFPHVVNLACKAIISAISNIGYPTYSLDQDPIVALRNLIRAIRSSSLRRQYFSALARTFGENLQLLRDVETRWSSTLLMIERALQLQKPIDTFISGSDSDLRRYSFKSSEWVALEAFKKVLAVPHAFQQKLSAEKTPTLCDAIPSFEAMMFIWEKQKRDYPEMDFIIQDGLDKLHDYRDRLNSVPAYIVSMLINPRMKLQWFKQHQPDEIQEITETFIRELRPYKIVAAINTPARTQQLSCNGDAWADALLGIDVPQYQNHVRTLEGEVNAYFLDTQVGTNLLSYWQENQLRYPTIFALAMDVLPIQGSAVPCERVFSSSKETISARRNRISADLMEALQMLKFAFKKGHSLDFTAGTGKSTELESLECEMNDETIIPEDIPGFIRALAEVSTL